MCFPSIIAKEIHEIRNALFRIAILIRISKWKIIRENRKDFIFIFVFYSLNALNNEGQVIQSKPVITYCQGTRKYGTL